MNYHYIIVEDNPGSLQNLQIALKNHPNYKEIGVATTLKKGINLTLSLKPHIVFLDVHLGNQNGFDLIKEVRQYSTEFPFIIMTTDFEQHAKKALNIEVLYFMDKPVDEDDLLIALNKFEKRYLAIRKHITLKDNQGHYFTNFDDITHIKADSSYVDIFLKDGSKLHVSKTLKNMQNILPFPFIRVHKSYIVNSSFIKMLNTSKKHIKLTVNTIEDNGPIVVEISDSYLENIRQTLLVSVTR